MGEVGNYTNGELNHLVRMKFACTKKRATKSEDCTNSPFTCKDCEYGSAMSLIAELPEITQSMITEKVSIMQRQEIKQAATECIEVLRDSQAKDAHRKDVLQTLAMVVSIMFILAFGCAALAHGEAKYYDFNSIGSCLVEAEKLDKAPDFSTAWKISSLIHEEEYDVNRDGETNCVDYASMFWYYWYVKYNKPAGSCRLVRNKHLDVHFNHLFVAIAYNKDEQYAWVNIEPYGASKGTLDLEQYWGSNLYDPAYNEEGYVWNGLPNSMMCEVWRIQQEAK